MAVVTNYAVEDRLSEAVLLRCFHRVEIEPGTGLVRNGFGNLR